MKRGNINTRVRNTRKDINRNRKRKPRKQTHPRTTVKQPHIYPTSKSDVIITYFKRDAEGTYDPTHNYSLMESGAKIGSLCLILKSKYPIWSNERTRNCTYILTDCRDIVFNNLKKEKMYSDWSINRTLDNLLDSASKHSD